MDLRGRQEAPYASLPFGAGGVALAFLRSARRGGAPRLAEARRWLQPGPWSRRADAIVAVALDAEIVEPSFYYSRDALRLLRILAALEEGERPAAALADFAARARARAGGPAELLLGTSGYLAALTVLDRASGDPRVRDGAALVARSLLDDRSWRSDPRLSLSHGRSGVLHALLGWSITAGAELPPWVRWALEELAADLDRGATHGAPPSSDAALLRSWCNGSAGQTLLWARAWERYGEPILLERARAEARFTLSPVEPSAGNLCCGHAGRAYAALALDRVDPDRDSMGWYGQAVAQAHDAMKKLVAAPGPHPNGLLRGFPGFVCLVEDLGVERSLRRGFPLVEG